jgi:hypothetical protein
MHPHEEQSCAVVLLFRGSKSFARSEAQESQSRRISPAALLFFEG